VTGAPAARLRATAALAEAGLPGLALERVASNANEVWFAGPYVLRVCPVPDGWQLSNEARIATHLPDAVPHPRIVAGGRTSYGEWLLLERLEGEVLSRAWPAMREGARVEAVRQLGEALRALHATPLDGIEDLFGDEDTLECPHQLPPSRVLQLLRRADTITSVDRRLLDAAREIVFRHRDSLDEDEPEVLVHGDLHFENVLWDGERVTALLDLEWSRPGPADLDLDILLRYCADPTDSRPVDEQAATATDLRSVPRMLRDAYPELFAHPQLNDRLAIYCLAYDVRDLLLNRPHGREEDLPLSHPVRRIRRLVEGRGHLPWMAW
jgi:aminoglycoside phosphotransferase (APT) family kinase protein